MEAGTTLKPTDYGNGDEENFDKWPVYSLGEIQLMMCFHTFQSQKIKGGWTEWKNITSSGFNCGVHPTLFHLYYTCQVFLSSLPQETTQGSI